MLQMKMLWKIGELIFLHTLLMSVCFSGSLLLSHENFPTSLDTDTHIDAHTYVLCLKCRATEGHAGGHLPPSAVWNTPPSSDSFHWFISTFRASTVQGSDLQHNCCYVLCPPAWLLLFFLSWFFHLSRALHPMHFIAVDLLTGLLKPWLTAHNSCLQVRAR